MKKVTFNENSLIKIKESMVGSSNTTSHNTICVTEARPEVDEFELGQESDNPPVGGNYCHVNEANIPNEFIRNAIELRPSKLYNWVVIDLVDIGRIPRYFQKRSAAYDYYKWLKNGNDYERMKGEKEPYKPIIINLDKEQMQVNESYNNVSIRGDMDKIDYIDYVPHDNPREEGYTADNITEFEPYYELTCYGIDGEIIFYGELTVNELFDYFPDKIIHALSNKQGRKVSEIEYRIDDILSWNTTPNDINDVEEVNAIAKRIQLGGPSSYILTDGDMVSFPDHIQITSIDGMTPSKFVGLGNIRVGKSTVELSKQPNAQQIATLRDFLRGEDEDVFLDIVQDGGKMYPNCICSAAYQAPVNVNRIINDIVYYFQDGVRPQGTMRYESKLKYKRLIENISFEVNSSDIDLSSFKKKNNLAPIWNERGELNPRIRLKLLDIADDFWNFVNLTWVKPNGIILTGSICNFNWSNYSDIDLHLIVDFDEIDEKTEFVRDYLDAKKNEWNNEHEGLKIFDFPIELYVQDLGEMPKSGGIYDLEQNEWLKRPNKDDIKSIGLNKFSIKDNAANIMTIIDDMHDALNSTSDSHEIEQIGDDAQYLWKKIKDMRKSGLETSGESSPSNIVYKILRRSGYLDKLWKMKTLCYDKVNSINEGKKQKYTVYINGKKDDNFSNMNWKRKPKVGKGFYCGGAVFKIKKVTDDSIYAIEENKSIEQFKNIITLLKEEQLLGEEFNADGCSTGNPYKKRWDAERKALKDFICNYGVLMQSKEDNKQGRLYKCFWDKTLSNLIGYNYCLAVQYDEINNKPKSTIYVRACDRFTPNIRRNLQYDSRGQDNQMGTRDDIKVGNIQQNQY